MRLAKATARDNSKLLKFFQSSTLPGVIDIRLDRRPDFFAQYKNQSDNYTTYMLLDSYDQIQAIVSIVFVNAYLNNEKHLIGWATDLRVSRQRNAILNWAKFFLPALIEEKKRIKCKYVFSLFLEGQRKFFNATLKPQRYNTQLARYHFYRRFQVISIHGRLPFYPKPLESIKLRHSTSRDTDALVHYISQRRQKLSLYGSIEGADILQDIKRWSGLRLKDFIVALDSKKNIVGCVAPWSSENSQRMLLAGLTPRAREIQSSLYFLSFLKITRNLPAIGQALGAKYLTHFFSDNPDISYSLLHQAWVESKEKEFLTYAYFPSTFFNPVPASFITARIKGTIYHVLSPNEPAPKILQPNLQGTPPELEIAFW